MKKTIQTGSTYQNASTVFPVLVLKGNLVFSVANLPDSAVCSKAHSLCVLHWVSVSIKQWQHESCKVHVAHRALTKQVRFIGGVVLHTDEAHWTLGSWLELHWDVVKASRPKHYWFELKCSSTSWWDSNLELRCYPLVAAHRKYCVYS